MEPIARKSFNTQFSEEKYRLLLHRLDQNLPNPIPFRVAETPVFLTDSFRDKLIAAGSDIVDVILRPDFTEITQRAIPRKWKVAGEEGHPHFITLDFGVCKDDDGNIVPKLIELQGFPSLYGFQLNLGEQYADVFNIPDNWTIFFNGLDKAGYLELLKDTIVGPYKPEEVVLMDVDAPNQKTSVDFWRTQQYLGIAVRSLADLKQEGQKLYYLQNDRKVYIKRIYNRLIFDEIAGNDKIFENTVDVRQPFDVEWITHPNWFYRISKFTMPFLKGEYVPATQFMHQVEQLPADLENYVLKPLFSFAGQGVIIDVTPADIENIKDPENWILQQKVNYEPAVYAPDGGVKVEIRLLYLWPKGQAKPTLALNLARLSKGKMIGVRYNKDFDWVGGTIAFMHKQ